MADLSSKNILLVILHFQCSNREQFVQLISQVLSMQVKMFQQVSGISLRAGYQRISLSEIPMHNPKELAGIINEPSEVSLSHIQD